MERTDYGTLLIPDIKISDAGTYLCIGTNAIGSSEAVIDVTVMKSKPCLSKIKYSLTEMQCSLYVLVKMNREKDKKRDKIRIV